MTERVLFCSTFLPRCPGFSGGEIRDFQLLSELVRRAEVRHFGLYPPPERPQVDQLRPWLHSVQVAAPGGRWSRLARSAARVPLSLRQRGWPWPFAREPFDAAIQSADARSRRFDEPRRLLCADPDFLFVSPQLSPLGRLLPGGGPRTRRVLSTYDVEALRVERLAQSSRWAWPELFRSMEARAARRFEGANLSRFDGVIAVSESDRTHFVKAYGVPRERVLALDNGVDVEELAFQPRSAESKDILYLGNLGYPTNAQAAVRLVRQILPRVQSLIPEARVWLVGDRPGPLQALHDGAVVHVTGPVPDVRPFLARAAVACLPLPPCSGTRLKLLQCWSSGLPVVATPEAAEGLDFRDGVELRLGESDEDLARLLVELLSDPDIGRSLAAAGRTWAEQRYAWQGILARLWPWLEQLASLPAIARSS